MELAVLLMAAVGVVAVASWYWSEAARIRRALRRARRVSIADAREGSVVRLQGRVAAGATLVSPLSSRRCVYYLVIVEERVSTGRSNAWHVRIRESRGVPFVIDDGTGRALVDPTNAHVDVDLDITQRSGTFDDPTPAKLEFLAHHGVQGTGWLLNKPLRYREGVFEIGEAVAVLCQPVREPDPDAISATPGYRDGPPTRLRVSGSPDMRILLSDAVEITQLP